MQPVYFLVQDDIAVSSVAGPVDIFHTANLLLENIAGEAAERLQWYLVGVDKLDIRSASGMQFKADMLLSQVSQPGWIYIAAGVVDSEPQMERYLQANQALVTELQQRYAQGYGMAANCTGTFLLAESGLLDGRSATTTWWLENMFLKRYPKVELDINQLTLEQDNILCSGSAMAYMELALILVEKLAGAKYAHLCRKYLLMENAQKTQAPFRRLASTQTDPFMQAANRYLLEHLHQPIRMDDLAGELSVSNRTLIRRFKNLTGGSPLQHLQKLRIERSKYLLETTDLSTAQIMQWVGYGDSSNFGQIFKRYTGLTPSQYRQKFSLKSA